MKIKLSIGRIVSDRLNEEFNLSFNAKAKLQESINECIKNAFLYDGKIKYKKYKPASAKKRKYDKGMCVVDVNSINFNIEYKPKIHTNLDVVELANLRNELREILDDNFKGRILSQETSKKIKRLKYLESKFK